jgi:pimeloyl-ACP methyl ester carboxylesterase
VQEESELQMRVDGDASLPTLIYLPGLHGDWTLLAGFRELAKEKFRLVQFTYPRTFSWRLTDYAQSVDVELRKSGIRHGWVLAESFSSQVAWAWLQMGQEERADFRFEGLILAGGFVRYPMRFNLACVRGFCAVAPWWLWRLMFRGYLAYGGFRHRNAPSKGDCAKDFVERRTPLDIAAMRARLQLIAEVDLREAARRTVCPVFQMSGVVDPVVPPWPVRKWMRKNCASFKGSRILWPGDHNVLGTEPAQALMQIEAWVAEGGGVRLA